MLPELSERPVATLVSYAFGWATKNRRSASGRKEEPVLHASNPTLGCQNPER